MSNCSFYQFKIITLTSREQTDFLAKKRAEKIPFCNHKHSKTPPSSLNVTGCSSLLKCGGDMSKCQLSFEELCDIG